MAQTPSSALAKIKQDFQFTTSHKDPIQAARSGLRLAFAYACGFGVPADPSLFPAMLQKCVPDALPITSALATLLNDAEWHSKSSHSCIKSYARFVQRLLKFIKVIPRLDGIGLDSSYPELEMASASAAKALGSSALPTSIYAVYHGLTHKILCGDQVDDADPATGETALIIACRMGDATAAQNLLSCGADPSKSDINGRLPLHWLFMFEPSEIGPVATRLTRDWSIQHINSSATAAYEPDVQFPLVLHGTPLAFAVAACSFQATEVLLGLGADPCCGLDIPDPNWGCRSPLAIAVSLHLYDIFSMLWKAMFFDRSYPKPIDHAQLDLLACGMSNTSKIERYLVHSRHYKAATGKMASLLRQYRSTIIEDNPEIDSTASPLEAAVKVMDWDTAGTLLKYFYNSTYEAKNWLLFFTLQVACRGTLTWPECKIILDFANGRGVNLNACFSSGRAIDILIAQHQGKILVDWLLPKKPQVTKLKLPQDQLLSPLWSMIKNGLSEIVPCKGLLSLGADPNEYDLQTGNTILHLAVACGTKEDVFSLLTSGASPWIRNFFNNVSFFSAIRKQDKELVSIFLKFIGNTTYDHIDYCPETQGLTALTLAASLPNNAIVTLLLEHGAVCGAEGTTALHAAVDAGNDGALNLLISAARHSQALDPHDSNGYTPLHRAFQSRQHDYAIAYSCASLLLEAGADACAIDWGSDAAIHMVFRHFRGQERLNMIKKLQSHGAQLDRPRSDGTTILHLAAFMNDVPMVKYLLQEGVSPQLRAKRGQTPLHDCVRSNIGIQHDELTTNMISDACCVIKMLAKAGESLPHRPYLKSFGQGTGDEYEHAFNTMMGAHSDDAFNTIIGAHGDEKSKNAQRSTLNLKKAWKSRRIKIATERKNEQFQRDNRIEGFGLTLFRDGDDNLSIELAAQRGSDQRLLQCLLDLHLAEQSPGSESSYHNSSSSADPSGLGLVLNEAYHRKAIQAGWAAAIRFGNWPAVKHLLLQQIYLDSRLLEWPVCDRLLMFGIVNADDKLMGFFTGHKETNSRESHWQQDLLTHLEMTNELGGDLCYLWDITRKIKKSRAHMKVRITVHDETQLNKRSIIRRETLWRKFPILINRENRSRKRDQLLSTFTRAMIPKTTGQEIGGCLEQLQSAWDTICNSDLQTLNLRLGAIEAITLSTPQGQMDEPKQTFPEHNQQSMKKFLPIIVSYDFKTSQNNGSYYSCAPGRTSTPVRLLYEVWGSRDQDPKRMRTLTEILLDYEDLWVILKNEDIVKDCLYFETDSDREWFVDFSKCIERHIAFLRLSLEKEMKKSPTDRHDIDVWPLDFKDAKSISIEPKSVERATPPQRPSGPAPPEEDDISFEIEL